MFFTEEFIDKIAQTSLNHFENLPKTGKPTSQEWTVLSTIVKENITEKSLEVVALATGSKCIGKNSMSKNGDILNDSHAEILCRRAFLRYLYWELQKTTENNASIFEKINDCFCVKNTLRFHFFSTHAPCGDAAIFPKQSTEDFGDCLQKHGQKRNFSEVESQSLDCKRFRKDGDELEGGDVHRTGGKCLAESEMQDPKLDGERYHVLGAVRTKPGMQQVLEEFEVFSVM